MILEIWSDIACPWCLVGKANLDAALALFDHADEVEILWRSFELDPRAPGRREGAYRDLLAAKYHTSPAAAQQMLDTMVTAAARAGVHLDFDRIQPGNTFDAHRLIHFASTRGLRSAMKERLLVAYLSEGACISDRDVLAQFALELGLEGAEVRGVLDSDAFTDEVRADEARALELGVSGVPFFLAAGRVAAAGAQPPDVLLRLLERGWELTHPAPTTLELVAAGEACGPDGCAVSA